LRHEGEGPEKNSGSGQSLQARAEWASNAFLIAALAVAAIAVVIRRDSDTGVSRF
jgi:hypothetical protein